MSEENEAFQQEKLVAWRAGINNAIDSMRIYRHKIENALNAIGYIEDELKDIAAAIEKEQTSADERETQKHWEHKVRAAGGE